MRPGEVRLTTAAILSAVVVVVALMVAAVALAMSGWKSGEIVGLLAVLGSVSAVLVGVIDRQTRTLRETEEQTPVIQTIDRRTNGEFARTIESAVTRAVTAALNAQHGQSTTDGAPETVVPLGFQTETVTDPETVAQQQIPGTMRCGACKTLVPQRV